MKFVFEMAIDLRNFNVAEMKKKIVADSIASYKNTNQENSTLRSLSILRKLNLREGNTFCCIDLGSYKTDCGCSKCTMILNMSAKKNVSSVNESFKKKRRKLVLGVVFSLDKFRLLS